MKHLYLNLKDKKGRCALDGDNQIAIDDLTKRYM